MAQKLTLDLIKKQCGSPLEKTENLSLHGLSLSSLDASLLNSLPNLEVLDVSDNRLRELPLGLSLPKLKKLDCSDNQLNDVLFLSQFPSLQELHIIGNGLQSSHKYIAFALCPQLKQLDSHKTDSLKKIVVDMTNSLTNHIEDIWDKKFADDFEDEEHQDEDVDDLSCSLGDALERRHSSFRTPLLESFGKFMIKHLSRQFVEEKLKLIDKASRPPPKKRARCSSKNSSPMKSPSKVLVSPSLRSPRKFTSIIPKTSTIEYTEKDCPFISDYDPIHFIRCHFGDKSAHAAGHEGQDPSDGVTEVWACQFEPSIDDAGKTKPVIATCGGEYVCLIDCSSGHVLQRFHQPAMAYSCLAWTTLSTEHEGKTIKQNVLVVAGKRGRLELFLPIQHLWYGSFGTDRPNQVMGSQEYTINCLCFHQTEPQWLFAGGSDGAVELWDIGVPQGETMKAECKKLAVFLSSAPQIVCLLWAEPLNQLIGGTDLGLFAWEVNESCTNNRTKKTRHPNSQLCLPDVDPEAYVDSLVAVDDDITACKVVGDGRVLIFSLKATLDCSDKKKKKKKEKTVVALMTLDWKKCEADFIQMGCCGGNLVIGDEEGNAYIYNLKFLRQKKKASQQLGASRILEWPECDIESQRESEKLMIDLKKMPQKNRVVLNACNISADEEYVVTTTSNNLVCIWKMCDE